MNYIIFTNDDSVNISLPDHHFSKKCKTHNNYTDRKEKRDRKI